MNLGKKKELAKRSLKVGKDRIVFIKTRLEDIKNAITKQDIQVLKEEGAIRVKEVKGRKTKKIGKRKRRSTGKIRKKVNTRKRDYVTMTRKLRNYVKELQSQGRLSRDDVKEIRKKIRNREFKSKSHLKQYIGDNRR